MNKDVTAEQLVELIKFTPRTYTIQMWGYGGEKVMGTVSRKTYDYFKHHRLDLSDYAWGNYDDEVVEKIPEDIEPFPHGSWYECDDMGHTNGVSRNAGTLQILDENNDTVFERSLEDLDGCEDSPEWSCNDEVWIDSQADGTVVFIGTSNEKGTFFEGEIELTAPFDIEKLTLYYDEVDGEELVNSVTYDGEDIDNFGGSTDGKSSDFGFYIAGSQKNSGKWEKYTNMDDIEYPMTEWFPKKINPVREGNYMIKTAGKNSWTHQAKWTGSRWISAWGEDTPETNEIKIKEWQGLAIDPDADIEWDPVAELDKLMVEFDQLIKQEEVKPIERDSNAKWPF